MSCVVIVLRNVLEVVACTAPRFWHRKCRYPQIREFMPVPQVPQFLVYRFICIFIGPKYILTYHPHTFDPQGLSQPRIYTSNSPCPRSGRAVRGSQLRAAQFRIYGVVFDIIDAKPIGLHPTNIPHQLGPSHRAKHYPSSQCYGPTSSDRGSQQEDRASNPKNFPVHNLVNM
jgi:hypothetical protein